MKNWLLIVLCLTLVQTQAQEKVSSIVTDNSNSLKYFSTFNNRTYLVEIYPNSDVLVYDWQGQEVGLAKSIRNLPGIGTFKNFVLGERSLLYQNEGKNYHYDFLENSEPKQIDIPNLDLGVGNASLPGFGSTLLGRSHPYYLLTSQSTDLIPLPVGITYEQFYHQYLITSKNTGSGNQYSCYNALNKESILLMDGVSRKQGFYFYNDMVWFLNTEGEVMTLDLKNKTFLPSGISTSLKNGSNSLFTDGRTLLICQSNPEKTYLEAYDIINGAKLWENVLNLEGGIEKNQIALYQNYAVLRTNRDKIITLNVADQFFYQEFNISAYTQIGIPILGPYLVIPYQDEFTFFDMQQQKIQQHNAGFSLTNLNRMTGTYQNFEVVFSCEFVNKSLPSLFSLADDLLELKNIQAYNTGCSTDARLVAGEAHLFLIDHSLFSINDQQQRLTTTSFRKGKNRHINYSKNKHYYLNHFEAYDYLMAHDGMQEDTLYVGSGSPKSYTFITEINELYYVFADDNLYRLDPQNKQLTLIKTAIRQVYEDSSLLYFKSGTQLGMLDAQGNIHEYDVMLNSVFSREFISYRGLLVFGSNWDEITVMKDGNKIQTLGDVFVITRLHAIKNYVFVAYISGIDFTEKWFSVDSMGQITYFDVSGINIFIEQARLCKDFLILVTGEQTHYIFDDQKNKITLLAGKPDRKKCLYLHQNGVDTLAYILEEKTLNTYRLSEYFSQQTLIRSLPFDYAADRLSIHEINGQLIMMGLEEMIVFDTDGRATKLPLNTYTIDNNRLTVWQDHYYCIAADSLAERQVYRIDFDSLTTSTITHFGHKEARAYPNPCSNYFEIDAGLPVHSIAIWDMQGKEWKAKTDGTKIDVTMLPSGLYIVQLQTEKGKQHNIHLIKR